jgi:hypothetical protein
MLLVFREYSYEAPGERGLLTLNDRAVNDLRTGFGQSSINDPILGGRTRLERLSAIELPFPSNLRDTDSLRVGPFEQRLIESAAGEALAGAVTGAAGTSFTVGDIPAAVRQISQYVEGYGTAAANQTNTALQQALDTNLGNLGRDALYLLRSYLPGNIGQIANTILGSAINPRVALSFDGVDLKQHSFAWTLAPKNSRESDIIKNIVEMLKKNSLPSYQTTSAFSFKAYLKYPSIVDIYLLGVNTEYFMKFKSCMIRNISVDYATPGLVPILKGGKPAVINLNLEFYEMDIHTANDYGVTATSSTSAGEEPAALGAPGPR